MLHRAWRLSPALALPLVITGCGGSSNHNATRDPEGVQQVTINTTDQFRFTPMDIRAHVGTLRIVLTDAGSYPHNISFGSLHATSETVSGSPGQQKTSFSVTFTHAGVYDFVCTFHSSAGMKGQVTVT